MNIDFIKWKVEYADGFVNISDEIEDRIQLPTGDLIGIDELESDYWFKSIVDPLLTQRAIEGVNREYFNEGSRIKPLGIKQYPAGISLFHAVDKWEKQFDVPFEADTYDQAKESALMYIYEQEKA